MSILRLLRLILISEVQEQLALQSFTHFIDAGFSIGTIGRDVKVSNTYSDPIICKSEYVRPISASVLCQRHERIFSIETKHSHHQTGHSHFQEVPILPSARSAGSADRISVSITRQPYWCGRQKFLENWKIEVFARPSHESFQISFADTTNGIYVSRRTRNSQMSNLQLKGLS